MSMHTAKGVTADDVIVAACTTGTTTDFCIPSETPRAVGATKVAYPVGATK